MINRWGILLNRLVLEKRQFYIFHFEILFVNSSVNWVKRKRIEKGIGECILLTNVNYSVDASHSLLPVRWLRALSLQNYFLWDSFLYTSFDELEWLSIISLIWTIERHFGADVNYQPFLGSFFVFNFSDRSLQYKI